MAGDIAIILTPNSVRQGADHSAEARLSALAHHHPAVPARDAWHIANRPLALNQTQDIMTYFDALQAGLSLSGPASAGVKRWFDTAAAGHAASRRRREFARTYRPCSKNRCAQRTILNTHVALYRDVVVTVDARPPKPISGDQAEQAAPAPPRNGWRRPPLRFGPIGCAPALPQRRFQGSAAGDRLRRKSELHHVIISTRQHLPAHHGRHSCRH